MQQGVYTGAAEPYVSRGVASAPDLPFSRAMDEAPFASPPMFRGVCPFTFVFCSPTVASFVVCTLCTGSKNAEVSALCMPVRVLGSTTSSSRDPLYILSSACSQQSNA